MNGTTDRVRVVRGKSSKAPSRIAAYLQEEQTELVFGGVRGGRQSTLRGRISFRYMCKDDNLNTYLRPLSKIHLCN